MRSNTLRRNEQKTDNCSLQTAFGGFMTDTIDRVFGVITNRQKNPKEGSYTNQLLDEGQDEILKKIGEEAIEVILAANAQGDERMVSELADLTYHCLVLLAARGLSPADIAAELDRRYRP
jgi:phosphoribosyl-ATP pyrophosphohydrolase